jgi:hypothetical protein
MNSTLSQQVHIHVHHRSFVTHIIAYVLCWLLGCLVLRRIFFLVRGRRIKHRVRGHPSSLVQVPCISQNAENIQMKYAGVIVTNTEHDREMDGMNWHKKLQAKKRKIPNGTIVFHK